VLDLQVVPEWSALVSISEGGFRMHHLEPPPSAAKRGQMANLTPVKLPAAARGVTRFAVAPGACGWTWPFEGW
jgi:hypothetical protein